MQTTVPRPTDQKDLCVIVRRLVLMQLLVRPESFPAPVSLTHKRLFAFRSMRKLMRSEVRRASISLRTIRTSERTLRSWSLAYRLRATQSFTHLSRVRQDMRG